MANKKTKKPRLLLFAVVLILTALLLDVGLERSGWIQRSGFFYLNDYEITRRDHPEKVWDRVIFGSSELVSGYREELSQAGYVNLGMDYGVMTDLEAMLRRGELQVGHDLVIALNWGSLCDELDTNPTYAWKRGRLEPYVYFQRDRLSQFAKDEFNALLGSGEPRSRYFLTQEKETYHGHMTQEELDARVERLTGLFFPRGEDSFSENLAALERVLAWCESHDLPVRALWLPEHPDARFGAVNDAVKARAGAICAAAGVELLDLTDALPAECFYDTGHMTLEEGAPVFTEVLDPWLMQ